MLKNELLGKQAAVNGLEMVQQEDVGVRCKGHESVLARHQVLVDGPCQPPRCLQAHVL